MISTLVPRVQYPELSYMGNMKHRQGGYRQKINYHHHHHHHHHQDQFSLTQTNGHLSLPTCQTGVKNPPVNQYKLKWILWKNHGRMRRSLPSNSEWDDWKWVVLTEFADKTNKKGMDKLQAVSPDCEDKIQFEITPLQRLDLDQDHKNMNTHSEDSEILFKTPPPPPRLRHKDEKIRRPSVVKRGSNKIVDKVPKRRGRPPKKLKENVPADDDEKDGDELVMNFDDLVNTIESGNVENIVNNSKITINNSTTTLKDLESLIEKQKMSNYLMNNNESKQFQNLSDHQSYADALGSDLLSVTPDSQTRSDVSRVSVISSSSLTRHSSHSSQSQHCNNHLAERSEEESESDVMKTVSGRSETAVINLPGSVMTACKTACTRTTKQIVSFLIH